MKIIIIGPSLSGKTTIIKSLRPVVAVPVTEMDDELTKLNNCRFPTSITLKTKLSKLIIQNILSLPNIIFFTNTDYFTIRDLKLAKSRGFRVIELHSDLNNLLERNTKRVINEGYQDLGLWLPDMLNYQQKIRNLGLFDKTIDSTLTTKNIIDEIININN